MNGLETEYGEQIDFLYLNAFDEAEGQAAFDYYALRGHPSMLLIAPDGEVIWQAIGSVEASALEAQLESALTGTE